MVKTLLLGFVAGFVAVLAFHQGSAFLLHHVGNGIPAVAGVFGQAPPPFNLRPVPPFGVPTILSQCFWGGVWGMALATLLDRFFRTRFLPVVGFSAVFGALALTIVAVTLVPLLKGLPTWNGNIPWRGLLYNGAWGFGVAVMLLKPLSLRP
jgi:hypothetical protein